MSVDPVAFEALFGMDWLPKVVSCQVLSDGTERWTGSMIDFEPSDEARAMVAEYRLRRPNFIGVISWHEADCPCLLCTED